MDSERGQVMAEDERKKQVMNMLAMNGIRGEKAERQWEFIDFVYKHSTRLTEEEVEREVDKIVDRAESMLSDNSGGVNLTVKQGSNIKRVLKIKSKYSDSIAVLRNTIGVIVSGMVTNGLYDVFKFLGSDYIEFIGRLMTTIVLGGGQAVVIDDDDSSVPRNQTGRFREVVYGNLDTKTICYRLSGCKQAEAEYLKNFISSHAEDIVDLLDISSIQIEATVPPPPKPAYRRRAAQGQRMKPQKS